MCAMPHQLRKKSEISSRAKSKEVSHKDGRGILLLLCHLYCSGAFRTCSRPHSAHTTKISLCPKIIYSLSKSLPSELTPNPPDSSISHKWAWATPWPRKLKVKNYHINSHSQTLASLERGCSVLSGHVGAPSALKQSCLIGGFFSLFNGILFC